MSGLRRPALCSVGLLLLVLALGGCGDSGGASRARASPAEGRRLFLASHCGRCHTMAAAGTDGTSGPDLDTSERLDLREIRASLVEGANGMPSYAGRLTARQLDAVAAFIEGARRAPR